MNIEKMTQAAKDIALDMKAKFPGLSDDFILKTAKFVVLSAEAIKEVNAELNAKGNELSEKGLELVFTETANHVFRK